MSENKIGSQKRIDELEDFGDDMFLLIDLAKTKKEKNRLFKLYKQHSKAIKGGKT